MKHEQHCVPVPIQFQWLFMESTLQAKPAPSTCTGIVYFTRHGYSYVTPMKRDCGHPFTLCVCVSCSVVSDFVTLWTVARQFPLSMRFSRQEYWGG